MAYDQSYRGTLTFADRAAYEAVTYDPGDHDPIVETFAAREQSIGP